MNTTAVYEMEIFIPVDSLAPHGDWHWVAVRPTGGQAYQYQTAQEASHMLDICYPEVMLQPPYNRRVVKVEGTTRTPLFEDKK